MASEFELAEVLWDVADPYLTYPERCTMCIALKLEPLLVVHTALATLVEQRAPLPANVFDHFCVWLSELPPFSQLGDSLQIHLDIAILVPDVERSELHLDLGRFSGITLCRELLRDAGVANRPFFEQAAAIRCWLVDNRPSPALRVDLVEYGFGYLIE